MCCCHWRYRQCWKCTIHIATWAHRSMQILEWINCWITLSFMSSSVKFLNTTSAIFVPKWAPLSSMKSSNTDTNFQSLVTQDAVSARNAIWLVDVHASLAIGMLPGVSYLYITTFQKLSQGSWASNIPWECSWNDHAPSQIPQAAILSVVLHEPSFPQWLAFHMIWGGEIGGCQPR